jgi:hypothetical protein
LKYERAWFKREGMRFNLTIFLKDIWYWRGKWYFYWSERSVCASAKKWPLN